MKHLDAEDPGPTLADLAADDYWITLYRYLSRKNPAHAEDLAQEVLIRLLKISANAALNPEAYVIQVANNVLIGAYHRAMREGVKVSLDSPEGGPLIQECAPPSCQNPEEQIGAQRLLQVLLGALPEEQQAALILHEVHGYNYIEIACKLGTTVRAVERYLLKAKARIRRLMDQIEPQGGKP
jgi:RNA polymerase sigma-70 factor (ECF subfamily)